MVYDGLLGGCERAGSWNGRKLRLDGQIIVVGIRKARIFRLNAAGQLPAGKKGLPRIYESIALAAQSFTAAGSDVG